MLLVDCNQTVSKLFAEAFMTIRASVLQL